MDRWKSVVSYSIQVACAQSCCWERLCPIPFVLNLGQVESFCQKFPTLNPVESLAKYRKNKSMQFVEIPAELKHLTPAKEHIPNAISQVTASESECDPERCTGPLSLKRQVGLFISEKPLSFPSPFFSSPEDDWWRKWSGGDYKIVGRLLLDQVEMGKVQK